MARAQNLMAGAGLERRGWEGEKARGAGAGVGPKEVPLEGKKGGRGWEDVTGFFGGKGGPNFPEV